MSLVLAAVLVSLVIALCCALPWLFPRVRGYARPLLLVGTSVLLGFLVFDLIPEMVEMGGTSSLFLVLASAGGFTLLHALGDRGHAHAHEHDEVPSHGVTFLLGSMALHCFAGGMLLVSAYEISARMALGVFLSLVAHKAFEAVSVSSVLLERSHSPRTVVRGSLLYVLSFPAGVLLTEGARKLFFEGVSRSEIERIALVLTAIAIGSLFGCLIQDFLLPLLREFRGRPVKHHSH
jgi:zinc transporter ZupT